MKSFFTILIFLTSILSFAEQLPTRNEARQALVTIENCIFNENGDVDKVVWFNTVSLSFVSNPSYYVFIPLNELHDALVNIAAGRNYDIILLEKSAIEVCNE